LTIEHICDERFAPHLRVDEAMLASVGASRSGRESWAGAQKLVFETTVEVEDATVNADHWFSQYSVGQGRALG